MKRPSKNYRKDLKLMERNGLIRPWSDHALTAGELWEARILQELNEADIIVCQLSRDFLASDFCVLKELETAILRKQQGKAELFAYVLKECGWKGGPEPVGSSSRFSQPPSPNETETNTGAPSGQGGSKDDRQTPRLPPPRSPHLPPRPSPNVD